MHVHPFVRSLALLVLAAACSAPETRAPEPAAVSPASAGSTAPERPALRDARGTEAENPRADGEVAARPVLLGTEQEARQRAADATLAGDYELARKILGELLVERYLDRARALLAENAPEDGLLWADRALEIDADNTRGHMLRGEGSFQLAEKLMAGSGGVFAMGAFEDSLASYLRAGESPRALFGASRAAYQLDRQDQALALADRGMQARAANAQPSVSDTFAYRTLAQAAWLAYVRAKQALPEAPSDAELARTAALFERARGGLGELLGRVAADADVWDKLSQIYEWEARYAEAQDTLAAGLDRQPNDPVLLRRLEAVAKRSGPDAVIAAFEDLLARHPEIGEAWYRVGWYRFERALSALEGGGNPAAEFERAESELARARKLVPARKQDCLGYEVVCRDGVGWCRYNQGDLEGAEAAFRSMEQLFDGGLAWFFEGRLLSGVQGLHFTGAAYAGRSADYAGSPIAKPEHLSRAAAIYGYLAEYQPNDPTWANNAGFFHRDAGVELEWLGRTFCRAAHGEIGDAETVNALRARGGVGAPAGGDEERAAFRAAANRYIARGREHMEKSYAAYLEATRLAPDDVSIVNDTALIAVYHLYRDIDRAAELLEHCVEVGAEQLESDALDEKARWSLQNAWGDAHQNLGILYFHHKNDPETARAWFEKSIAIGPEPRPLVTEVYLKLIDEEAGFDPPPYVTDFLAWGRPCAE